MSRDYLSPGRPVLELKIGPDPVAVVPHFLESFSHEVYAAGVSGQATITLFDPSYEYIENLILQHHDKVSFRYGWYSRGEVERVSMTDWRKGIIWKYSPRFSEQGLHIDINLADTPLEASLTVNNESFTFGDDSDIHSISDLVKKLADRDLKLKYTSETIEESEPCSTPVVRNNMSTPQFISHLCTLAKARTGRGGYRFWVDENNLVNFRSSDPTKFRRIFVFGKDQDSDVISFSPSYDGMQALSKGAGDMAAIGYDELTRSSLEVHYDPVKATAALRPSEVTQADIATFGKFGMTSPTPNSPYVAGRLYYLPFSSKEFVEAWGLSKHTMARNIFLTAELVIIGDVTIFPMDSVGIQIVKRTDGSYHYLSGYYLVQSVKHQIVNGMFTTTLSLSSSGIGSAGEELSGSRPTLHVPTIRNDTPGRTLESRLEDAPGEGFR